MEEAPFFREIEHGSDLAIEVFAPSRLELFARALEAMGRLMVAPEGIDPIETRTVAVGPGTDQEMLHDLLAAALNLFLIDEFVWTTAGVTEKNHGLEAYFTGERLRVCCHWLLSEIKAVTYHQLSIAQREGQWLARIVFDI